jgi:spore coat protein H
VYNCIVKRLLHVLLIILLYASELSSQPVISENGPLFIDTTVPRIDIAINPDTLQWIYDNVTSDREFHAVFVFDNGAVHDTIDPVGFRLRGNTSRYSKKKSFRVSFNTFTPGGKYYGVEKLNLNGEHNDPSVIRSKVMWDILRKLGIAAPRANHVQVYINGNYYGLYINVENIDEEFALSRFGNKNGNLYKCLYPADLAYRGTDPDSYKIWSGDRWVYELTTNEEENDFSDLAALINVLENSPDDRLVCDMDTLFNTYDFLKIMAADIFCGDWDGYIYNKNNFYLYHNTATGKMEYIPYDVDNTFGIDWFGIDWAMRDIYAWQPGGTEERPLYDRLINHPEFRKQFSWYANKMINSTLDIDSLIQSIEVRKNMIAPYIAADPYYPLDYGYDPDDFTQSYTTATGAHVKWGLYPYLQARRLSMLQQIEQGTVAPVIKYVRYRREQGQGIVISAYIEAEALPVTATVLYSISDGSLMQSDMSDDGSGTYTAILINIPDEVRVSYQVMATDASGRFNVIPCQMAKIRPVAGETPRLFINEFMADNEQTISDEYGSYSDWIEIYNGDTEDIGLGSLYVTDNFSSPAKWKLPDIVLQPGGFALFWADGNTSLGDHHASFKLDKEGEEIGLFSADLLIVDTITFGAQSEDISCGRKSDGAAEIVFFSSPTPGKSNDLSAVDETGVDEKLMIYPNPATGTAIRLNQVTDCRIFNSSGVLMFAGKDVREIDVSSYPPGLYILVSADGQSVKFIVF